MTIAPQSDQWRLLDVQACDTRLAQLAHRRRTLPEHAAVTDLQARQAGLGDQLVSARTAVGDVERELAKADSDVTLVRQRADRNQARLDSGAVTPKDVAALQHEIESLARRQEVLEDVELEVMERLEGLRGDVGRLEAEQAGIDAELEQARTRRDAVLAELDREVERVAAERAGSVAGIDAALLALYERIRESAGGVGAAPLHARRCQGCHLELTPTDLNRIRTAPPDEVLRCEECRRILVRTSDSGL